jgi:AcrR family transcriptional regulator
LAVLAVPIDDIARRAGVGVGTVYRHFPTKEALFAAIVLSGLSRLMDEARSLAAATDPGEAFFGFLSRLVEEATSSRALKDAMIGAGVDVDAATSEIGKELTLAVESLLTRAQQAGAVRDDIGIADLTALIAGTFHAMEVRGGAPESSALIAAVLRDGLRPTPA